MLPICAVFSKDIQAYRLRLIETKFRGQSKYMVILPEISACGGYFLIRYLSFWKENFQKSFKMIEMH